MAHTLKNIISSLILVLFIISLNAQIIAPPPLKTAISGNWLGSLKAGGQEIRIVFKISSDSLDKGKFKAFMDSPDQGAYDIPMDECTFKNGIVNIKTAKLMGEFTGAISADQNSIQGTWNQAGMTFPLDLSRTDKPVVINRPQEPKEPFNYDIKEVEIENKEAGITLSGTLTLPKSRQPAPAVVLVSGSGPQNRNEEIFGHKPFWVIADYLTNNGIAVLRYDDRGVGKSTGDFSKATTADLATDASAAVSFLKSYPGIIKDRIGIIGHSEGGMIAPMVASADSTVAFIVLMAGPGTTGREILMDQVALVLKAEGYNESYIKDVSGRNAKIYDILASSMESEKAKKKVLKLMISAPEYKGDKNASKAAAIQSEGLLSPWFRQFVSFDPARYLAGVKCPVLAINGSIDLQVPSQRNLRAIDSILRKNNNTNVEIKEFPGLNHLFQHATTGAPSEYNKIEETIAPEALEYMKEWIVRQVK